VAVYLISSAILPWMSLVPRDRHSLQGSQGNRIMSVNRVRRTDDMRCKATDVEAVPRTARSKDCKTGRVNVSLADDLKGGGSIGKPCARRTISTWGWTREIS
jgi:hypothetical protein